MLSSGRTPSEHVAFGSCLSRSARFYMAILPRASRIDVDQPPFSPIRSGPKAASKPSRQKQIPSSKKTLARRTGNLRSRAMKTVLKFPGSSKIWHGSGAFPAEIPTTAKPNHHLSPSFPRNPLSPPSDPVQRRLQSPSAKSNFLAVTLETMALK